MKVNLIIVTEKPEVASEEDNASLENKKFYSDGVGSDENDELQESTTIKEKSKISSQVSTLGKILMSEGFDSINVSNTVNQLDSSKFILKKRSNLYTTMKSYNDDISIQSKTSIKVKNIMDNKDVKKIMKKINRKYTANSKDLEEEINSKSPTNNEEVHVKYTEPLLGLNKKNFHSLPPLLDYREV